MSRKEKVTLGNISNIITGPFGSQLHQSDYVPVGIACIMPQNIGNRTLNKDGIARITKKDAERLSRYVVRVHDIVYARRGDVEKHAYISSEDDGALCGTGCMRVRVDSEKAYPLYVSFYLNRPESKRWISQHAVGSNMPNLNTEILNNVPIELPAMAEQKIISHFLENIDRKIQLNVQICAELEAMAKNLYDYWFVQFDFPDENGRPYRSSGGEMVWNEQLKREIPKGWDVTAIGKIADNFDSQRVPLSQNQRANIQGTIPYYGATGIMDYINDYIFDGQYVLIAEDGSVMDDSGHPIVQMIWDKTWVNNHAHVLQGHDDYSNEILYFILKGIPVVKIMTGSIQKKINQDNLNNCIIPSIPRKILCQFHLLVKDVFEKIHQLELENKELTELRDWLLPMLMNGQARVE